MLAFRSMQLLSAPEPLGTKAVACTRPYLMLPWHCTTWGLQVQAALAHVHLVVIRFQLACPLTGSCAVQEVVDALERYLCSGERRSMQWIPSHGPVRLQRLVMSARKDRQGLLHPNCLHLAPCFALSLCFAGAYFAFHAPRMTLWW